MLMSKFNRIDGGERVVQEVKYVVPLKVSLLKKPSRIQIYNFFGRIVASPFFVEIFNFI